MIVYATLQLYNEQDPSGKPFDKEFESVGAMYDWLKEQTGHPFLSYRLINYEECGECESDHVDCGSCFFRGIDGGPGPVMVCNHPRQTKDMGYVVSWNDARTKRLAKKEDCPLVINDD